MDYSKIMKNAGSITTESGTPDENELKLISRYTRKMPEAKDIYTFTVTLCDNEVDRDCERFSLSAINELKNMFEGVTGIFDHSMKSSDQTARIYKTEVVTDSTKVTSCGEPYTRLKAWCYMLRTQKNEELIGEIDGGIKKEVSISCSVRTRICSVCGNDMRSRECNHIQGENIDGKVCHAILSDPADAYEWSFVAVPAQRNAGVSKSAKFTSEFLEISTTEPEEILKSLSSTKDGIMLTPAQLKSLSGYIGEMETHVKAGKALRDEAQKEIVALSAFTLPDADAKMMASILDKLSSDEIFMLRKAFTAKAESAMSFAPKFRCKNDKNDSDNSQFKI